MEDLYVVVSGGFWCGSAKYNDSSNLGVREPANYERDYNGIQITGSQSETLALKSR